MAWGVSRFCGAPKGRSGNKGKKIQAEKKDFLPGFVCFVRIIPVKWWKRNTRCFRVIKSTT